MRRRLKAFRKPPEVRIERVVASAVRQFEAVFCQRTVDRLGSAAARLQDLVAEADGTRGGLLAELKADPGPVSLDTLLREIDKLAAVRDLGLPAGFFDDASEKLLAAWRARAARSWPSDLWDSPREVRLTLLAALCWMRQTEITDALVDLLIALVHKVNARAERRVERELTNDLRRVRGKEGLLFRLADAALEYPDEQVHTALYPVVGENTLRDLLKEAKANERAFQARVRTVLRGSYSNHYRRMLPSLLAALEFRCNNTAYRPIMQALQLLDRYREVDGKARFCGDEELVPFEGVVPKAWRDAVVDDRGRTERIPYELCVLVSLRDALPRGLRGRRDALAQPGRRPTRGFRNQPGCALRRAAPALGRLGVHRRVEAAHDQRPWASWSTRPSPPAIRSGGARAPPVPATPRSSARGSRT